MLDATQTIYQLTFSVVIELIKGYIVSGIDFLSHQGLPPVYLLLTNYDSGLMYMGS